MGKYDALPEMRKPSKYDALPEMAASNEGMLAHDAGVPDALQPSPDATFGEKAAAFGTGAMEGMTFGGAPYVSAAADFMSNKPYMDRVSEQQKENARRRARAPGWGTAGDIAGSFVPGVIASPFAAAAGAQKLGKLGTIGANAVDAAGQNAIRGAFDSQSTDNLATDAGVGLAAGALGAGLAPAINRGMAYGGRAVDAVTDAVKSARDFGLEKIGGTNLARRIVNPDSAIESVTLGAEQKKVYNTIADVLGTDNLGTSAAKATAEQKAAAATAMVADAEKKLGTPVSEQAKVAIAAQVDEAIAAGAESGATLGGALRLMVKDDPAAVSKRVMTSVDAWAPITPDMDQRAHSMRELAGQLRGDFEGGKLNRAFGQGAQTGRAYDIGYQSKPGYASQADIAANEAPLATKVGDLREKRMMNDEARFQAVPSTALGVRPFTAETASAHDLYQAMKAGGELPFPLDETQLNKLWGKMDDLQAQYGPLGTKTVPVSKMGRETNPAAKAVGAEFAGNDNLTANALGPANEPTVIRDAMPSGSYDVTKVVQPPAPPPTPTPNTVPPLSDAARVTQRQIGRQAVNKVMPLIGAMGGFGAGGGVFGAGAGAIGGMLTNTGIDVAAAAGKTAGEWGRKQLSPAALASSWLENPTILQSAAQRPDALGRSAAWVLKGVESGAAGMKSRAFTLALDPHLRAMMASLGPDSTDRPSQ